VAETPSVSRRAPNLNSKDFMPRAECLTSFANQSAISAFSAEKSKILASRGWKPSPISGAEHEIGEPY
jgi:hypothetical protein